ncbi:hypothetical protein BGZ63DRAFT_121114 [Mariannaea sp. PMI_226]|nr:hypothetical protein BGZ63DRAFT_121114 [Mariannaea sp. PMI_226]
MMSMQQNMQMHDELAALFSRNLTFNPEVQAQAPAPTPAPAPEPVQQQQQAAPEPPKPIVYSSQHYTHSAHVVRAQAAQQQQAHDEPQRHSSEPPQSELISLESVLREHGVDPSTLTPSQVQLFRTAEFAQKTRLIELWCICPPGNGGDIPAMAWSSTTVEQEEHLAQQRYEIAQQLEQQQQQQLEQQRLEQQRLEQQQLLLQQQHQEQQQRAATLDPASYQTGDGRWVESSDSDTEPYMLSGYEEMMRRETQRQLANRFQDVHSHFTPQPAYTPATDPVYMGPDYARQQQMLEMASQYGNFQQFGGQADAMDVM